MVSHKAPVWAHSCIFCKRLTSRKSADKLVLPFPCTRMTFSLSCMPSHRNRYRQAVQSMMTALDRLTDWMRVNQLRLNQGKTQFMWIGRRRMLDKIDPGGIHSRFPDVEFLTSVSDLGVVLDESLDMDEQIGSTCRSCYYHLRQIRGVRHSLSDVAARTAIQAFITSRIDYCNATLLGLSSALIDRVQHMMNLAAPLLLKLPKFSHISARMKDDLHWLPVSVRIQFKITFTMWKCISGCAPDYLRELCHLLSTNSDHRQMQSSVAGRFLLEVPRAKTVTMQRRAFAYAGPTLWNNMPEAICLSALLVSPDTIKKHLKTFFFSQF